MTKDRSVDEKSETAECEVRLTVRDERTNDRTGPVQTETPANVDTATGCAVDRDVELAKGLIRELAAGQLL